MATVDLRGHGSSSTGWDDYSETAVAQDLLALAHELSDQPAVLIGSSYSGGAAVVAAAREPAAVAAVVLTGAFVRDLPSRPVQRVVQWLVTSTPLGRRLWLTWFGSLFPGAKPADLKSYRAALAGNLAEPGRWAAVAAMAGEGHADAAAALPAGVAPALVVMGTADPDFPDPAAEAENTARRYGGPAEVLLVEGAGHYPHAEQPDLVAAKIVAFLRQVRSGQPCPAQD